MNRRHLLVAVGGLGTSLSGCLGQGSTSEEQTDSPTPPPADDYCPDGPGSQQVEVPAWPDEPDSLTRETVRRFATRYEEAFRARLALPSDTDNIEAVHVSASASGDSVTRADSGWLVHFAVREPELVLRSPTPTESPHYDPAMYPVSYFVSDDAVFRAMGNEVDPRETGSKLDCHRPESSAE